MIIELLLDALFGVFKLLTTPINIPPLPAEAEEYITSLFSYMQAGAGIIANYAPLGYMLILFGVLVAVDVGIKLYQDPHGRHVVNTTQCGSTD